MMPRKNAVAYSQHREKTVAKKSPQITPPLLQQASERVEEEEDSVANGNIPGRAEILHD
jgi:hypothetical protein